MNPTPGMSQAAPAGLGVAAPTLGSWRRRLVMRVLDPSPGVNLVIELTVLYIAALAALLADSSISSSWSDRALVLIFPPLVFAIMVTRRPDGPFKTSLLDPFTQVLGTVSVAAMFTVAAESGLGAVHPVSLALRLWLFSVVYLGIVRTVLFALRREARKTNAFSTPTLVVGAGLTGMHLVERLIAERAYGLRPVAFLDAKPMPTPEGSQLPIPVLGDTDNLVQAIENTGARHVILAFSSEPDSALVAKMRECERAGVSVSLVPRFYEAINERTSLSHIGGLPLLTLRSINPRGWQFAVKHTFDAVVAAFCLILLSPLMLVIAGLVRVTSPGPVLFRQRRVGRDNRQFDVLKFRTMRALEPTSLDFVLPDGIAPGGIEGIDRRTGVGRVLRDLSLDELPQLINVLKGDMSLVGPRPERPEFVARFLVDVAHYEERHRVKSGITGWAQVHGLRGQTSIADRVEWDNFYIQNWSLRLDFRILALTIAELLRFRG